MISTCLFMHMLAAAANHRACASWSSRDTSVGTGNPSIFTCCVTPGPFHALPAGPCLYGKGHGRPWLAAQQCSAGHVGVTGASCYHIAAAAPPWLHCA